MQFCLVNSQIGAVAAVLRCFGSLYPQGHPHDPERPLAALLKALWQEEKDDVQTAAQRLIEEAVPEPGELNPKRATIERNDGCVVMWKTPAGVELQLSSTSTTDSEESNRVITVDIFFGRFSKQLAMNVLCRLQLATGLGLEVGTLEAEGPDYSERKLYELLALYALL